MSNRRKPTAAQPVEASVIEVDPNVVIEQYAQLLGQTQHKLILAQTAQAQLEARVVELEALLEETIVPTRESAR